MKIPLSKLLHRFEHVIGKIITAFLKRKGYIADKRFAHVSITLNNRPFNDDQMFKFADNELRQIRHFDWRLNFGMMRQEVIVLVENIARNKNNPTLLPCGAIDLEKANRFLLKVGFPYRLALAHGLNNSALAEYRLRKIKEIDSEQS